MANTLTKSGRARLRRVAKICDEDNLRIYQLRGRREDVVEAYGKDSYVDFQQALVI